MWPASVRRLRLSARMAYRNSRNRKRQVTAVNCAIGFDSGSVNDELTKSIIKNTTYEHMP